MKIGIFGKNARQGASLASLVDEVVGYEEQGFTSYWMQQASTFHALTMMGVIGHSTSRIELGIATIPTYPRHPGALVHQAWTVNVLAGGRLVLGIGPTAEPEYEALGLSYEESVRHIRDYVGAEFEDDDKANAGVDLDFPEPQLYKVLVSALTPEMRRAAGHAADGVVTWMVSQKTIRNHTVPEVMAAAEDAERDAPRIAVGLPVCVHDDKKQAVARANEVYAIYSQIPSYRRQLDAQGVENPGDIAVVGKRERDRGAIGDLLRRWCHGSLPASILQAMTVVDPSQGLRSVCRAFHKGSGPSPSRPSTAVGSRFGPLAHRSCRSH